MLINGDNLATAFRGFSTLFDDALAAAPQHAERLAMMVSSSTREQAYPFLAAAPKVREWLGARQVHQLAAQDFAIRNRTFELTVEVPRDDLADDQIGGYKGLFAELGHSVAEFREELVFELLAEGFDRTGWDGVPFFSASHPITDATIGTVTTWSNFGGGSGTPWFLLDVSRPIRPFIWQEREPFTLTSLVRDEDPEVFNNNRFVYGVRGRGNAGYGLPQLAYASRKTLNATNYAAARAAMMGYRGPGGRRLGIMPGLLVVPPALESAARKLVNTPLGTGGESNEWAGTAELLVTPWLSRRHDRRHRHRHRRAAQAARPGARCAGAEVGVPAAHGADCGARRARMGAGQP